VFLDEFEPAEVNLMNCYPTEAQMRERIEQSFNALDPSGRVAAECWSDYRKKLEAWHTHRADFEDALHNWPDIRTHIQSLVKSQELTTRIMHAVSSPLHFADLTPPPTTAEVQFAFFNAPLIRHRLTLGDLFVFLNWDQESLWAQVKENL